MYREVYTCHPVDIDFRDFNYIPQQYYKFRLLGTTFVIMKFIHWVIHYTLLPSCSFSIGVFKNIQMWFSLLLKLLSRLQNAGIMRDNGYIDNILSGCQTEDELLTYCTTHNPEVS